MLVLQHILFLTIFASKVLCDSSYAPYQESCPSTNTSFLRKADDISQHEKTWLSKRNQKSQENLKNFLQYTAKMQPAEFLSLFLANSREINIGLAFSGGGFRAMLAGAGQLAALDNRTTGAFEKGLGGLLESSNYISGLSGGSWLLGTLLFNNFDSIENLILDNQETDKQLWDLDGNLFGIRLSDPVRTISIMSTILKDIKQKRSNGYKISLNDIWGLGLVNYFTENSIMGNTNFNQFRNIPSFVNADMPFPIVVSNYAPNDTTFCTINSSTVFETNPYEFGSWDTYKVNSFFNDITYLGTNVSNGYVVDPDNLCTVNFDKSSFVLGTSSNTFTVLLDNMNKMTRDFIINIVQILFGSKTIFRKGDTDDSIISIIDRNPFKNTEFAKLRNSQNKIINDDMLNLGDGGNDRQVIPIEPLLVPQRNVDILFAFDNMADRDDNWPDGTSMIQTYQKQFIKGSESLVFPEVPHNAQIFVDEKLNKRPVFFGCQNEETPLVVYVPNSEYSFASNTSVEKMSYSNQEKFSMIRNGFETSSSNNLTENADWQYCVGCAIIKRSQDRNSIDASDACQKCFQKYCWNK